MTTYFGTDGNDKIDGLIEANGQAIDALGGDDHITLGSDQIYMSGPGIDTIVGNGKSVYSMSSTPTPGFVDLEQGYAMDGFGFRDKVGGIHTVFGSTKGVSVFGTDTSDSVLVFGGQNTIDLKDGFDTVALLDYSRKDYLLAVNTDTVEIINIKTGSKDILRGVERLEFRTAGKTEVAIDLKQLYIELATGFSIQQGDLFSVGDAVHGAQAVILSLNRDDYPDIVLGLTSRSSFSTNKIGEAFTRFFLGSSSNKYAAVDVEVKDMVKPVLIDHILATDVNGDGVDDLIIAASGQDPYGEAGPVGPWPGEKSYVYISKPGGFENVSISNMPTIFAHHSSMGDINNDGKNDIFILSLATTHAGLSYFLLGDDKGTLTVDNSTLPTTLLIKQPRSVSPGNVVEYPQTFTTSTLFDANGDGALDLALLPFIDVYSGVVFLNDGAGYFSDLRKVLLPPGPFTIQDHVGKQISGSLYVDSEARDVNGDGRLDLISIVTREAYRGATVQILINGPNGFVDESVGRVNFYHEPEMGYTHYEDLVVNDVNADGFDDLLLYRSLDGQAGVTNTRILLNDGSGRYTDTHLPFGLPEGLFLAIRPSSGKYALWVTAGQSTESGQNNQLMRIDGVIFDWSKGLDFFTGLPRQAGVQISDLPGRWLHGTTMADQLTLSSGHERGFGYGGSDSFEGLAGNDTLDGGDGVDTALFSGQSQDYNVTKQSKGAWQITDQRAFAQAVGGLQGDGIDQLYNVERVKFYDKSLAIDLDGNAGTTAKILGAVFGKGAVANKAYAGIGLHYLDNLGYSYEQLMGLAINAALGPTLTHGQVVDLLYKNVVGVLPDAATKAMFVGMLDRKEQTSGSLGVLAAETDLNKANIDLVGLVKTGLEYLPFQS